MRHSHGAARMLLAVAVYREGTYSYKHVRHDWSVGSVFEAAEITVNNAILRASFHLQQPKPSYRIAR
jgi:hypothetical protein